MADVAKAMGQHASDFVDRLDTRGVQGVADDLSRFGRQHPWAFLGLSIGAGFLVGRLARTTAAVVSDGQQGPAQLPTSRVAAIDSPQSAPAMSYSGNGPSTADGGQ